MLQAVAESCALGLEASRVGRGRLQLCIRLGWRLCAAALTGGVQAVVWPRGCSECQSEEIQPSAGSQMPRHLISDAHEWINEIPTVPIYYLAKPQPRERAWQNQRGKKTLLSLTLVRLCEETWRVYEAGLTQYIYDYIGIEAHASVGVAALA
nr:expressed protein [Hymenolepis microstoma]CUU98133.1 hypothetical transcript [Hymenolepis microstoma]